MQIFKAIITNVLTALYQPFWFVVILSVLFMFVYKAYPSIKKAVKDWISWFNLILHSVEPFCWYSIQ